MGYGYGINAEGREIGYAVDAKARCGELAKERDEAREELERLEGEG